LAAVIALKFYPVCLLPSTEKGGASVWRQELAAMDPGAVVKKVAWYFHLAKTQATGKRMDFQRFSFRPLT
jgi:hypothetical protein